MPEFYPDTYEAYRYTRARAVARRKPWWRAAARRVLDTRSMYVPSLRPGTLLEIGCASGSYLEYMHGKGWDVEGLEPDGAASQAARERGLSVVTGTLETVTFQKSYDLIVGWMVLEHLHHPLEGLRLLRKAANPGAHLCLSVPNAASIEFRLFRERWFALHLPAHLYHFTPETVTRLLNAAGWGTVKIFPHRSLTSFSSSMAYAAQDFGCDSLAGALKAISFSPLMVYGTAPIAHTVAAFGQTGAMTLWATP